MKHQNIIVRRCFIVKCRRFNFSPGNLFTYVTVAKQLGRVFIAEYLLPHLKTADGISPCSSVGSFTGFAGASAHQSSAACSLRAFTKLKTPATQRWWAGNSLALPPPLMKDIRRFQCAVGQRCAAVFAVLVRFGLTKVKLKVIYLKMLIFKARIDKTPVALKIQMRFFVRSFIPCW